MRTSAAFGAWLRLKSFGLAPLLVGMAVPVLVWLLNAPPALAYTANKVWFEFREGGVYRVYVNYTVPELKEMREAYVDFRRKKDAEGFYWDLVRGADFYPPKPELRRFVNVPLEPDPW